MIVVDTSAVFAFLAAEPDALSLIAAMRENACCIGAPTWVETSIVVHRQLGADGGARLRRLASELRFAVVAFDRDLAEAASEAHRRFGRGTGHPANLNFGDCFSYALASRRGLPLLFKGNDFVHTDIVPALNDDRARP